MSLLTILELLNYGLVLLFGFFLSIFIAGGWENRRQMHYAFWLCPLLLALQGICWYFWGTATVKAIYPLIAHFPLLLFLIFVLKKNAGVALISICTAYLCCQLPRWIRLLLEALTDSALAGVIGYTLFIIPIFFLLYRYFVQTAYKAMIYSAQSMILFGSLPCIYYLFDYAATVYSDALYARFQVFQEFLPTILIIFYVIFITAYHAQLQKRNQAELHRSILEAAVRKSGTEIDNLKQVKMQAAIYQHDMRHHLNMIGGYLAAEKLPQAIEYIEKVQEDVASIIPRRFCENEAANLLCSSFSEKAKRQDVNLTIDAKLPKNLCLSDTELCSVLSNGLENALNAVSSLEMPDKWITLYCGIRQNKLLIEIKNPYSGEIVMHDGLPVSTREHHGYGCRSIHAITQQYNGLCSFEPEDDTFTLRVILPVYHVK